MWGSAAHAHRPGALNEKSRAFLEQARADFAAFGELVARTREADPVRPCHQLLFLQMAGEKLAKSFIYCREPDDFHGHTALRKLPHFLTHPRTRQVLGYRNDRVLGAALNGFRQYCDEIARLSPAVAGGEMRVGSEVCRDKIQNIEYPWQQGGQWQTPKSFYFDLVNRLRLEPTTKQNHHLLRLVFERAEQLMPDG